MTGPLSPAPSAPASPPRPPPAPATGPAPAASSVSAPSAPAPATPTYQAPPDTFCRSGVPVAPPAVVPRGPGERTRLLGDMMRDLPADSPLRERAITASAAFSTDQLRRMQEGGVRFATADGVPCERALPGSHSGQQMRTPGRYLPEARTIQLRDGARTGEIMHEMAHAWDDVRNDRLRFSDAMSPIARERMQIELNHQDAAGQQLRRPAAQRDPELRGVPAGFHSDTDRDLNRAYDAYQARFTGGRLLREEAFDLGAEGHSRDSPREFYAEGVRVFHLDGGARERLIRNAPELYRILYSEAQRNGTLPQGAPPPAP